MAARASWIYWRLFVNFPIEETQVEILLNVKDTSPPVKSLPLNELKSFFIKVLP